MTEVTFSCDLPVCASDAFAWHERSGALTRLLPPWSGTSVKRVQLAPGASTILADGGEVELHLRGMPWDWLARHRDFQPGKSFTDEQVEGPFKEWVHVHDFIPQDNGCRLEDRIQYTCGSVTSFFSGMVARDIERMFAFRHQRTTWDLSRHAAAAVTPQTIAITGASGLIGTALQAFLSTGGHAIKTIGRKQADIRWDVVNGTLEGNALAGVDTVFHLAGETVAQRWNDEVKKRILDSRVNSTTLLAKKLADMPNPPRTLIVASGIGYYGTPDDDRDMDENTELGSGFLAEVSQAWEAAAEPARAAGIRVVHVRIGMVLSAAGGALGKMLLPFRCGAGGPVGSGQQWMSWIHLDDLLDIFLLAMADENITGAINATTPQPVRQCEFAAALAEALRRPAFVPLPAFAVKLMFGEMGQELLLKGARVLPQLLSAREHMWRFPSLDEALRFELGTMPVPPKLPAP